MITKSETHGKRRLLPSKPEVCDSFSFPELRSFWSAAGIPELPTPTRPPLPPTPTHTPGVGTWCKHHIVLLFARQLIPRKCSFCSQGRQVCVSGFFLFRSLYKANRFHVAVGLFSNRSRRTSTCGKNKEVAHELAV